MSSTYEYNKTYLVKLKADYFSNARYRNGVYLGTRKCKSFPHMFLVDLGEIETVLYFAENSTLVSKLEGVN